MFKTVQPCLFSFDVEWVPDPMAGEMLFDVADHPPQSYHASMQRLWREAGASEEKPRPFIRTMLCRVVSIAGIFREVDRESGEVSLRLVSLPNDPEDPEKSAEPYLLNQFFKAVGQRKPQLVGYNSNQADIPILVQRAIVNGVPSHGFCERPDKPWQGQDYFSNFGDSSVDLGAILGRFRDMPRLHEAATLSGIPGKIDISGDSVATMWLAGKLAEIVRYNEYDAFTTHLLWARMAGFAGLLDEKAYQQEQESVRALLEKEIAGGRKHLQGYLEEWDRLNAINEKWQAPRDHRFTSHDSSTAS